MIQRIGDFNICNLNSKLSGVASSGGKGAECPLTAKKLSKIGKKREKSGKRQEKSGKNQEKEEKSGRKSQNREASFTLPLLTNRAGYATE